MKVFLSVLSFAMVCYAQDDLILGVCGEGTVLEGSFCVPSANEHAAPFVRTRDGAIELGIQGARLTLSAGDEHGTTDPTAEEYVTIREDFITSMINDIVDHMSDRFAEQMSERLSNVENSIQGLQNDFGSFSAVAENTMDRLASDLQAQTSALGELLESELERIETEMQNTLEDITTQINDNVEVQLEQLNEFVQLVNETFESELGYGPPVIQSCLAYKRQNPHAETGVYTVDVDGDGPIAPRETVCDMETARGGWTMFIRHEDNGNERLSNNEWNNGIEFAAAGGIRKWMVKTYRGGRTKSTLNGDAITNGWMSVLPGNTQGGGFRHFLYRVNGCNNHRYTGMSYIASSSLLPGSSCNALGHGGRYLWGEHNWCGTSETGTAWWFTCASPYGGHMLLVNHGHGNYETGVLDQGNYHKSDVAFEFFFREE